MKERRIFRRVHQQYRGEMVECYSFCEKSQCHHCIRLRRNLNYTTTERLGTGNQSTFRHIRIYGSRASPTDQHRDENANSGKGRTNKGTNSIVKERFHDY